MDGNAVRGNRRELQKGDISTFISRVLTFTVEESAPPLQSTELEESAQSHFAGELISHFITIYSFTDPGIRLILWQVEIT